MQIITKITQLTLLNVLVCLLSATAMVQAKTPETLTNQPIQNGESIQPGQTPDGISAPEWNSIQQQINAGKYRAYPDTTGGYNSSNPAHGWQIRYSSNGTTTLSPHDQQTPSYHLGMTLKAIGYQTLQQLNQPQQLSAKDSTVTYKWDDSIKEWWINSPTRLEQWFSIAKRPAGASNGVPLTLQLILDSELRARQSENSIQFTDATGTKITYDKLKVWDTSGRILSATMQLTNNILSLIVEDNNAQYPLTIDPSFQQQTILKSLNTSYEDFFGGSVAIDGDTLVVGAYRDTSNASGVNGDQGNNSIYNAGAAYVFIRIGNTWRQQAYLKASNTWKFDEFGHSVAIAGNTIVIGAPGVDISATEADGDRSNIFGERRYNSGAAYVFTREGTTWSQQAYLRASNSEDGDHFGYAVSIANDTVVIGTPLAADSGAVYVFTRSDGAWSQQAYLKASNSEVGDKFGFSVSIDNDTVVVGAYREASNSTGVDGDQSDNSVVDSGAAYVFIRSGDTWSQQAYLKASNTNVHNYFGYSIAIANDTVVVGALLEESNAIGINGDQSNHEAPASGAVYVFTRSDSIWSQQAYLKASNTEYGDYFGASVSADRDTVVVGAHHEINNGTAVNSGAAYVFTRSNNMWNQRAYLKPSADGFVLGWSVAVSGNSIVAGAVGDAGNSFISNDLPENAGGSAYVFNLVSDAEGCLLDVDGNANTDALTDGLLLMRYLFGSRGESLTANAIATDCIRCSADELEPILEQCTAAGIYDIDGNGELDTLTDGLLMMRFLFGIHDDALIKDAVADNCSRCTVADIEMHIQKLAPGGESIDPLSGEVWLDSNGNAVHDDNETGAELITVTVTDESIPITRSTYTDSNGRYTFKNLPPGNSYRVNARQDSQLNVEISDTETTIVNLSVDQLRNIIQADSITCTLQDAITSSIKNQSIGGCTTGIDSPNGTSSVDTLIDLNPASEHPSVTLRGIETQFHGSLNTEIKGNGSIIDEFSLVTSDTTGIPRVVLRDLIIGKINNQSGGLTLDQVTVENAVIQRGYDSFTDVLNSTIGSFDAVAGSIHSSTVRGDTNGATTIKNSNVGGTVFLDIFNRNSNILKNSTIAQLATVVEQQSPGIPLLPKLSVKIEESRINGLLINNFDAVIPKDCYTDARIFSNNIVNGTELIRLRLTIDPQCLLN
jgi:hypothetical protein